MRVVLIFIYSMFCFFAQAQITINEVCSDNETVLADEEGDFEDWIELYNDSNDPINLQGYTLSDDEVEFLKWSFPNIEIPAKGYLLLFASDKDFVGQQVHTNFKLSKNGELITLSNPQQEIIDQVSMPALGEDQAYGRQPDGSDNLVYFSAPSPESSNNNQASFNFALPPTFTNTSFFTTETTSINITCPYSNCNIYYTLDGSIPDETDPLYQGPISLDTTTTIRAAAITPDLLLSKPATRTFFINEDHRIPVMALTTAPENLWDYENGIFAKGPNADSLPPFLGANFWSDREIPMYLEYFEKEILEVEYPLGAEIHGGTGARSRPMKPLRLLAKQSFGTSIIDYPFFKNRSNTKFERLVLRNSSGDFNICHMRDEFLARYFIDEDFDFEGIAEQPVVVYINGIYWGVMHLREKVDNRYLEYLFDVDRNQLDLLEEDTANLEGTFDIFDMHEAFILNNDMSDPANYNIAASYFDISNLSDYIICQTFVNNTDWPSNNLKYWRPYTEGAKWRYILFDMDVAMALQGWTKASINSFGIKMEREDIRIIAIFKSLLESESFRHYFINRYADLINTSFSVEEFTAEVNRSRDELDHDMKRHLPKWGKTYDGWYNVETPKLFKFANERPMYARQFIGEYFNLFRQDEITLRTFPQDAGTLKINSLDLTAEDLPWQGIYFNAVPIDITIQPATGFTFSHWESNFSDEVISTDISIKVQPRMGEIFTAVFEHDKTEPSLSLYPNPVDNLLKLQYNSPQLQSSEVNIYDSAGRLVFSQSGWILGTGEQSLSLDIQNLDEGVFTLQLVGSKNSISQKFVKIRKVN